MLTDAALDYIARCIPIYPRCILLALSKMVEGGMGIWVQNVNRTLV